MFVFHKLASLKIPFNFTVHFMPVVNKAEASAKISWKYKILEKR